MKKTIATITLAAVMTFGATFAKANGGIIVAGVAGTDTCSQSSDLTGIIVAGMAGTGTGIIVAGLAGIIVAGVVDTNPCTTATDGIIVAG